MLGAFSISLKVKDIHESFEFYQKLGFYQFAGHIEQHWLVLKNGDTIVCLFEGMLEENMMTFNPGWDQSAKELPSYEDIRELKKKFMSSGITIIQDVEKNPTGPAHFMVKDPDGNVIFFDQHVG